ncbi:MAG: hypothetical protein ACT4PT_09100 [Methanobacteriota archaeon]
MEIQLLGLDLSVVSALWVLYALGSFALGIVVLRARPAAAGNYALAAILFQQTWGTFASIAVFTGISVGLVLKGFQAGLVAWLLWAPVVFLAGPLTIGRSQGMRWALPLAVAGSLPSTMLLLAWPVKPSAVVLLDQGTVTAPTTYAIFLVFIAFATTVAVFTREAMTTPLPVRLGQFALLAAAFSVEGAFHAGQDATQLLLGYPLHGVADPDTALVVLGALPILLFALVAAYAARVALTTSEPGRKKWATRLVAFILAAAVSGAIAAPLSPDNAFKDARGVFHAVWDMAALCLIFFAGMRYQLFSLEMRAKQGVAVSVALVTAFLTFNVIQELVEGFLATTPVFAGIPAGGVAAALVVATVSIPIAKVGEGAASKLFPHVRRDPVYEKKRKIEIYQAALEGALADGHINLKEVASLRRLREALQVEDADHEHLEHDARARLVAAGAQGPAAA